MPGDVAAIRETLQCSNPRCSCHRPRGRLHCPAHDDKTPDLSLREKDGVVLVHCFGGCTQDAVIEALRARGLWEGSPSPTVRAAESRDLFLDVLQFLRRYILFSSDHAAITVVLWVALAWTVAAFDLLPYLAI